ncbi:DUF5017 domain-containing protein [Pedobacter sp. ASV1-7]|jgi:hypothetical protein|uniref:DUF5017 domain-containing protein n=1 Tax=Pedobacter sp. ASV1-7 TaxID=3145237 RepID=UPI0032E866FF
MNRKIETIILSAALLVFGACSKDIPLTPGLDQFNVTSSALTYKLGDTVKFSLVGNPDLISFYSGELYKQYEYKEGRDITLGEAELSFSSAYPPLAAGSPAPQVNPLSVMLSTDFNGKYNSYENVDKATWTDITNKFVYGDNATYKASGKLDITNYIVPGKPLYLAYKYVTKPIAANGPARSWYVYNIELTSKSIYESHLLGNLISSEFKLVEKVPSVPSLSTYTTTRITLSPYRYVETTDPDPGTETWAISKAFNMEILDKGPDRPFIIKGNEDAKVTNFSHVYTEEGTYKVHFIGTNANVDGSDKKVIEMTIKVVK